MGARRCGIFFSSDIKLNTRREITYLQATMCYFVYYTNILMRTFLTIFRRLPITFRRFPNILQKSSEGQINVSDLFPQNPGRLTKIGKDFRGRSDDV